MDSNIKFDFENSTFLGPEKIIFRSNFLEDKKGNLVDYKIPDGSGTLSLDKKSLLHDLYLISPLPYPLSEMEIHVIMEFLENNDIQLWQEILKAYAFGCFIPAIISCRALLESLVDKLCEKRSICLKDDKGEDKSLSKKIKEAGLGQDLKDFMYFNNFISNKAAHEIYNIYGRSFNKTQATILLSCTLLIINEIKQNYVQSTTATTIVN